MPKDMLFRYIAPKPDLPIVPVEARETNHNRLRGTVKRAVEGIADFNMRVLNNPNVMDDLLWLIDGWQRLKGMADTIPNFTSLDLPATAGPPAIGTLVRRIQKRIAPWLLHPALPDPDQPRPEVPAMFGAELRNPFLPELDHDSSAIRDRKEIEERDQSLASYLKQEAEGGPSYADFFQMQDELRFGKLAREYDGPNPFGNGEIDDGAIERSKLVREISDSNRILARQLEAETKLTGFNPFPGGPAANGTTATILFKTDESLAFVLDVVATWRNRQIPAELKELETTAREAEQRRAMEEHKRRQAARR